MMFQPNPFLNFNIPYKAQFRINLTFLLYISIKLTPVDGYVNKCSCKIKKCFVKLLITLYKSLNY